MKLHKKLSDDELKIAFLIVSTFPSSEIEKSLQEEGIILDTGDFNWSQVAQLLRIEMYLRGIEDNIDFQEKYLSTKNTNKKK